MVVVKFAAFSRTGQNIKSDFEVALAQPHTFVPAQKDVNGDFFTTVTPPAGGQAPLGVRAKPKDAKFWPLEGHFAVDAKGNVRPLKHPLGSFFIRGTMQGSGSSAAVLVAQLSVFRDITDQSLAGRRNVPDKRQGTQSPPAPA